VIAANRIEFRKVGMKGLNARAVVEAQASVTGRVRRATS
jgi:hypothetical protein